MGLLDNLKKQAGEYLNNNKDKIVNDAKRKLTVEINDLSNKAQKNIKNLISTKKVKVEYQSIPTTFEEFMSLDGTDLKNEFKVAALTIIMLNVYANDAETGKKILDYLNGPENVSAVDTQFIENRFMDEKQYVVRSFFKSTSPENNYTCDRYVVEVMETEYSRKEENYVTLYLQSTGADNLRELVLRRKPSTNQWFVWNYKPLLGSIRVPAEKDSWN